MRARDQRRRRPCAAYFFVRFALRSGEIVCGRGGDTRNGPPRYGASPARATCYVTAAVGAAKLITFRFIDSHSAAPGWRMSGARGRVSLQPSRAEPAIRRTRYIVDRSRLPVVRSTSTTNYSWPITAVSCLSADKQLSGCRTPAYQLTFTSGH